MIIKKKKMIKNFDEILSDFGNSLIIYEFVELVRKFFLQHESLLTRLQEPQTYSENYDFFRVLWRDSSFLPSQRLLDRNNNIFI